MLTERMNKQTLAFLELLVGAKKITKIGCEIKV